MKKQYNSTEISRKEAINKIANYGKYSALIALGVYVLLNLKKAQAATTISPPGSGF